MRLVRAANLAPRLAAQMGARRWGPAHVAAIAAYRTPGLKLTARLLSTSSAVRKEESKESDSKQADKSAAEKQQGQGEQPASETRGNASSEPHSPHWGERTPDGKAIGPDGQPIATFSGAWNAAKEEAKVRLTSQNDGSKEEVDQKDKPADASATPTDGATTTPAATAAEATSSAGAPKNDGQNGTKSKGSRDSKDKNPLQPSLALGATGKKTFLFLFRFGGLIFAFSVFLTIGYKKWRRMIVYPDTWLYWNLHGGSIVEDKPEFGLVGLLGNMTGDMPQHIELFEAVRALNYAAADPRVIGLFADFSNIHNPNGMGGPGLGLAQMEELAAAIVRFKVAKKQQLGNEARVTVAWSDTFNSQTDYALASTFDEVYMLRSGDVPLTGLAGQIPFAQKLLGWFGIKMRGRARKEYKSMVSTFTQQEGLTPAQADNQAMVMGELSRTLCSVIGSSRWPELGHEGATEHVYKLASDGPFFGQEALDAGLITDLKLKSDLLSDLFGLDAKGELPPRPSDRNQTPVKWYQRERGAPSFMSVPTYSESNDKALQKRLSYDEQFHVGMVMANQSISPSSATEIIRGLNEAAEDEKINAIVLRVDSPGGDVISSEEIWDAVRRVSAKKPIVASFGDTAASGGYYISTAADLITASQGTLTGSIGVASLSPQVSRSFFDKIGVYLQSFFTGSTNMTSTADMSPEFDERLEKNMDNMYGDFLSKVAAGRGMTKEAADTIAGGRVWTGLQAYLIANKDVEAFWNPQTGVLVIGDAPPGEVAVSSPEAKKIRLGDLLPAYEAVTHPGGPETGNPVTVVVRKQEGNPSGVLADVRQAGLPTEDYGRGLVDAVGGVYDAAALAWQMGLQREVADKVASGLSEQEAMDSIRPRAPRTTLGNQLVLQGDLSIKRYPAEKGFFARLTAPDTGERPRLTGSPIGETQSVLAAIATNPLGTWEMAKAHVVNMMARSVLRALATSASDVTLTDVVRAANQPALLAGRQHMRMMYGGIDTFTYQ